MSFRDALQTYLDNPERHKDQVLWSNEDVVIIRDLYPKSTFHYLILPKLHTHEHPLYAFKENEIFYREVENYVKLTKEILRQNLNKHDAFAKLDGENFINTFLKVGVHSIPSLKNLHIHVISKDFHSPRLKNKKHYNSFNTDFFVDFEKLCPYPRQNSEEEEEEKEKEAMLKSEADTDIESGLSASESDDLERKADEPPETIPQAPENKPHHIYAPFSHLIAGKSPHSPETKKKETNRLEDILKSPLICSYCGRNFDNKFSSLKVHLKQEFNKKFSSI
ncbi:aprataxin-like protein [[Candida] railenensis]|uniref:Aprataxin-like protein n=1 Tax=[Candida] railenensis TaxID=45579 RepID=A0A9P0W0R8_9ASCO|nr:aprataxin-like protein [[Candida] railenensis]